MRFHLFWTIAKYEAQALQRGWFFRIFVVLSLLSLGIFNYAMFNSSREALWIFKAMGAAIPYANMILLNLAQAVVAIFLASEFLKQDQKNDTVEVIYVRSMSNTTYVLGKTMGILMVFLGLNFLILVMATGFSYYNSDSTKDIFALFLYPLLISLPTLIFIIGLSFSLMVMIKNQAITFILLLGYIALTLFYLNKKAYHVFDYIAYQVPMMYSSFTGFGDLPEILLHRGIYLLIGVGLIFFTIYKLGRLPQTGKHRFGPLTVSLIFLLGGVTFASAYLYKKNFSERFREQIIIKNNLYPDKHGFSINSCEINLIHLGSEIKVLARLDLENKGNKNLDTLILSLNPALNIERIDYNGTAVPFIRDLHLIKIPAKPAMEAGYRRKMEIVYKGGINEDMGFSDLDKEEFEDNFPLQMFTLRKRFAYLTPSFVCLTSATNWYPTAGAGYTSQQPYSIDASFTKYKLKVKTAPHLVAISQGKPENLSDGEFSFIPEHPQKQLSLIIGPYTRKSVMVDSIEYNLYTKQGNDYYSSHLNALKDTIPQLIRNLVNEYQVKSELTYPFHRFSLVEVPIHFATDRHKWTFTSDAVQPEMIFYPEKGVNLHSADIKNYLIEEEKRLKREGNEVLAVESQSRLFHLIVKRNFFEHPSYNIFPQYYNFSTHLVSKKWPAFNMAMEIYLQDRRTGNNLPFASDQINLTLEESSMAQQLSKSVKTSKESYLNHDIINTKAKYLFASLKAEFGEEPFDKMIRDLLNQHRFKNISFEYFDNAIQKNFGRSIEQDMEAWYHSTSLPAFLVRNVQLYKIAKSEKIQYQVVYEIANTSNGSGLVNPYLFIRDKHPHWGGGLVLLPPLSAKRAGILLDERPASLHIKTTISKNLPGEITIDLRDATPIPIDFPKDSLQDCALFTSLHSPDEIVVDNEDSGFKVFQNSQKGFLKAMIDQKEKEEHKYKHYRPFDAPAIWTPTLNSRFYGVFIHSAVYVASGTGEIAANWYAKIDEPGFYEVYFYSAFIDRVNRRHHEKIDYNMAIYHDDGKDEIRRHDYEFETGWNYLGTYYISDSARVSLSDKSNGEVVIADAVKWIKSR